VGANKISHENYCWGQFAGVLVTGIVLDLFMKERRFLMILILNVVLYGFDIYLFYMA